MTFALTGIGVSRGIVAGSAYVQRASHLEVTEYSIVAERVEDEVARFGQALAAARQQLRTIRSRIPASTPADIAAFIDTHLLMLDDGALSRAPVDIIRRRRCNAEWALKLQCDELVSVFDEMDDAYLSTRKDDVNHVVNRVLAILLRQPGRSPDHDDVELGGCIVIADDLTPADTILMKHQGIAAFVTEHGGVNSHSAILARSLGIPAIVAAHHVRRYIRQGELVIVDAEHGVILADADSRVLEHVRERQLAEQRARASLGTLRTQPTVTRDGHEIRLMANVETPDDVRAMKQYSADGIGLYRTELLYMNRGDLPTEEEQYRAYLEVVQALDGAPLTIRTVDLGADKQVDGGRIGGTVATNPALGLRAIRLCLRDPKLFFPQLYAILRVSVHGPVRMMLPMLTSIHELSQVMRMIAEARLTLVRRGESFDAAMPVGGMIEVPAAALAADLFADQLDFLSLGTNDLIQYTLAVDRLEEDVSYLYDPLHPAVLRLIQMTIAAGERKGIPVSMCGEMAGEMHFIPLLLGLGLREFSMHPSLILEARRVIRDADVGRLSAVAGKIVASRSHDEIVRLTEQLTGLS
ncbi:MAG: phosphotransferase system enzyme I PtsI [Gammaproteobacteria bacterium]|nr:MAG: phosphotransferase system enzyme I PtsI [Gammaproteobacteria bacterium]TND02949.1 MAG: phosphotransferase system, enzyme I, PtsI [Gammaproteobacteria bacterium]